MLSILLIAAIVSFVMFILRKMTGKSTEERKSSILDTRSDDPQSPAYDSSIDQNFSVGASVLVAGFFFALVAGALIAAGAVGGSPLAIAAAFIAYRGMRHGKVF